MYTERMNPVPTFVPLLAPEAFCPLAERSLPSLEQIRQENLQEAPTVLREHMERYFNTVCRIHYNMGLVRIVDALPDLEGIRLRGPSSQGVTMKAHIAAVVGKPGVDGKRAVAKAEKALQSLRASLPRDTRSIEMLFGAGPLNSDEEFLLTAGTAASYLARLGRNRELGTWLAQNWVEETLGQVIPVASSSPPRHRM